MYFCSVSMSIEHRVPLVERAALAVLARSGESGIPCAQQRAERQRLRHAVVEPALAGRHLGPLLEQLPDLRVDVEAVRATTSARPPRSASVSRRHAGVHLVATRCGSRPGSATSSRAAAPARPRSPIFFASSCAWPYSARTRAGRSPASRPARVREHLPQRRVVLDRPVHPRLRDRRVVHLAVAVAAVADQVDDDVAAEGVAELGGQAGHAGDRRQVLAVHVEDRDRQPARDVGRESAASASRGRAS